MIADRIQEIKDVLPTKEEYIKKLIVNSGFKSSHGAIQEAKKIPN